MIEKQLKIGDHIVDAGGNISVIEAVNKASYRVKRADGCYGSQTIPFNGMQRWGLNVREYFVCDDVQLKIIENLGEKNRLLQQKLEEQERDVTVGRTLKENLEWLCQNKLSDLERCQDDDYDEDDD